jgi:hypothetical protein
MPPGTNVGDTRTIPEAIVGTGSVQFAATRSANPATAATTAATTHRIWARPPAEDRR